MGPFHVLGMLVEFLGHVGRGRLAGSDGSPQDVHNKQQANGKCAETDHVYGSLFGRLREGRSVTAT